MTKEGGRPIEVRLEVRHERIGQAFEPIERWFVDACGPPWRIDSYQLHGRIELLNPRSVRCRIATRVRKTEEAHARARVGPWPDDPSIARNLRRADHRQRSCGGQGILR